MIDRWLEIHRHLLAGDYDDWWPGHADIRTGDPAYKDRFEPTPTFGRPVWDGSSFDGTLLVNANFGMGDTIQFYRFMPLVRARVGRVILRCDEDFRSLFRDTEVAPSRDPLPEFDQIIHMMALPKVLGVKKADIAGKPYLSPQPCYPPGYVADMASTIKAMRSSKIGLCWRGNPFNPRDRIRSMPESARDRFLQAIDSGIKFFSLNKIGPVPPTCWNMKPYMSDWDETARLLEQMDLVVSVDTAVAHLAGAMGVPTWVIVPTEDPDWRWGVDGDRTLWYDSMRLFRNTGSWDDVVDAVAREMISGTF